MKENALPTYKLLVLDLDGTLTNSKKEISETNLKTLIQLQQSGVRIVLASGRPTYGIVPLAETLQLKKYGGFILSYNGGEIIEWSTGEILYKNLLPNEVLPMLYDESKSVNLTILTYDEQYILTENPSDGYVQKEAFLNKMQIRPVDNFLEAAPVPLPKCLIVGDPQQLMQTEAELSLRLQGIISVYRSEPYFLEVVPLGIDKARSLAVLLDKLSLTRKGMVAMGNGYNDRSMIEFAGNGHGQRTRPRKTGGRLCHSEQNGVTVAVKQFFKL